MSEERLPPSKFTPEVRKSARLGLVPIGKKEDEHYDREFEQGAILDRPI